MGKIKVCQDILDIDLVVFDKDGLLFSNEVFWIELATLRLNECQKFVSSSVVLKWLSFMGIEYSLESQQITITGIQPAGVFAVASPTEETIATAAFLIQNTELEWIEAYRIAHSILEEAEKKLSLETAIKPHKGFPDIFLALQKANIPYGIATSDTYERAWESVNMFDDAAKLSFIVSPVDVVQGKPNPEMLEVIHKKTGVPFEKMLMIGDSFVDVEMAQRAGAIGVGIPQHKTVREKMRSFASYILENLTEIEVL